MESHPYKHLRKDLLETLAGPVWPIGIRPAPLDPQRHAKQAHDILAGAYKPGTAHVGSFEVWWQTLRGDAEYDPALFFLALDEDGRVIGLAHCWKSAFLKDLAVSERWRRRGIGKALLLHTFADFRGRGATYLDLKVENDNASGAERLYRRLGMKPVE